MKARTEVLLQAAEAALQGICAIVLLYDNDEREVWYEMCTHTEFIDNGGQLRCLYLCFLAAANETGDL